MSVKRNGHAFCILGFRFLMHAGKSSFLYPLKGRRMFLTVVAVSTAAADTRISTEVLQAKPTVKLVNCPSTDESMDGTFFTQVTARLP